MEKKNLTRSFIGVSRHRINTDGDGVTTLACFYGCPLRCKYCINPQSFAEGTVCERYSPEELYRKVAIDQLYFLATGGGVMFGGGEPLLHTDFISEFRKICGDGWKLHAETSLCVPRENVIEAAGCIDVFYVDCKDTNPDIYKRYTGKDNALMLENLRLLVSLVGGERIVVRLPLIPGFNTNKNRDASERLLSEMGITRFDRFNYIIKDKDAK